MNCDIIKLLKTISLFKNANDDLLASVLSSGTAERTFAVGDTIFSRENNEKNLVIILSGKAQVLSFDSDRKVILRTLGKGDVFGVAELFGDIGEVSRIEAVKECKLLFIPETKMGELLESDKQIMYNYLNFLCCRIRFLSKRIACFTAGSAERRLAFYLDSLTDDCRSEQPEVKVTPEISMAELALMLDIGRASLYRAIDTLSSDGFIERSGKNFILRDREKMLKSYNK
ncbi:MAG: Crp/Fnr family transcriptional regulator [Clostridia bacterium]|nr:Crp/Fnr family transcriptional regulator [Clostridia bacterium]